MDERQAHVARLRELSAAQKERALSPDELREVAGHFRAIGDEERAAQAERAAAAAPPEPVAAGPPAGDVDDPSSADYRQRATRVQTVSFACREVQLGEDQAATALRIARGAEGGYPAMRKMYCEFVGTHFLPPLPVPTRCVLCGAPQADAALLEQAPFLYRDRLTVYTLAALNATFLDLGAGEVSGTVSVVWRLCSSCRGAVAGRLQAVEQHRSRLLAAKKAAGGLGGLFAGKRQRTADEAEAALREIGYTPLAGECYDLPRVVGITGEMYGNEVTNSGTAARQVEFAAAGQRMLEALEDAAADRGWQQVQLPSIHATSVYDLALDLAARFDRYTVVGRR